MNIERIKEIQQETAYPESISVQQALLKVWNECEQEKAVKNNAVLSHVGISLDLCELERKLDEALEKETRETLTEWIKQQRQ